MAPKLKMLGPSLLHSQLRKALWLPEQKGLLVAASDGLWLYSKPLEGIHSRELVLFLSDSKYHDNRVLNIQFNPYSPCDLICKVRGCELIRFNLETRETHALGLASDIFEEEMQFSPDGEHLIVSKDGGLDLYHLPSGRLQQEWADLQGPISAIDSKGCFLANDPNLEQEIIRFDFKGEHKKPLLSREKMLKISRGKFVLCERVFWNGEKIITLHNDAIRVWDAEMGQVLHEWKAPSLASGMLQDVFFDGKRTLLFLREKSLSLVDTESGRKQSFALPASGPGRIVSWSEDRLVLMQKAPEVAFWDRLCFYELKNFLN